MFLTKCRSGLLAVGLLFAANSAKADVISYTLNYSVSASFTCDQYVGVNCSVSGNAVTLFDNGGSMSFQFMPATGSVVSRSDAITTFSLGSFTTTVTGGFSAFPKGASNEAIFSSVLVLSFTNADPTPPISLLGGFYRDAGNTSGRFVVNGFSSVSTPSLPKGFGVGVWSASPSAADAHFNIANGSAGISAATSISPEPSTIVLSASGLGIVGLVSVRRRRRSA